MVNYDNDNTGSCGSRVWSQKRCRKVDPGKRGREKRQRRVVSS